MPVVIIGLYGIFMCDSVFCIVKSSVMIIGCNPFSFTSNAIAIVSMSASDRYLRSPVFSAFLFTCCIDFWLAFAILTFPMLIAVSRILFDLLSFISFMVFSPIRCFLFDDAGLYPFIMADESRISIS